MSTAKFNTWQNPDGTENYKCRAWVNSNGTGTVAIRAAGNVSSITDNGVGDYTVNFTTAMPDANYSFVGTAGNGAPAASVLFGPTATPTAASVRFGTGASTTGTNTDYTYISIAVFR